jgi:hypothetical protein
MFHWKLLFLLILVCVMACQPTPETAIPQTATSQPGILATPRSSTELQKVIPALASYEAQIQDALKAKPPILLLAEEELSSSEARLAQSLAIQNPQFIERTVDPLSGEPLRNEIMSVRPALPSDYTTALAPQCSQSQCYRVELYNYVYNAATIALVDVTAQTVLAVTFSQNTQPELNQRLTDLATQIAVNSPEVIEALRAAGLEPAADSAVMPNIKTALNGSRCENSQHLCVAPTFLVGERALWAIVDLTDRRLVGIRWTELGASGAEPIVTERTLQNEYVMENFCEKVHTLARDGWELNYVLTNSDGLAITNLRFEGQPILDSAKLVDWHVSYSGQDGFGYSDAVGCPMFSSASVAAFDGPQIVDINQNDAVVGFTLVQDFRSQLWPLPCNYRYENRYEFYQDGRFRVIAANYGRGCGNDGTYRPVLRIDFAKASPQAGQNFAEWNGAAWTPWQSEQWQLQTENTTYTPEGYQYRITQSAGSGYYLQPGQGQFSYNQGGDNAFVYITTDSPDRDEGDSDLITIGPCCNNDYQQGPEKFMAPPEAIADQDLVLWYVPQLKNSDVAGQEYCWANTLIENGSLVTETWPCFAGPMFVPFGNE